MLEMKNGFVITDNDCMQCRKHIADRKYVFVQVIKLEEEYIVLSNMIDVSRMSFKQIGEALDEYYDGIEDMERQYNEPLGKLDWLIAECEFETMLMYQYEHKSKLVSWNEAEYIIQKFIDTNGQVFLDDGKENHSEKFRKINMSDVQKEYMNDIWDGDELCPECDCDTSFEGFNPMETEFIKCQHCGKKIHPCMLCDHDLCGVYGSCQESLLASLLYYNDKWDEEINGEYLG